MNLFAQRVAPSALGDDFARPNTLEELQQQKHELERALTSKATPYMEVKTYKTRLSYVEQWIWEFEHGVDANPANRPWEWPGPIAPIGMKAIIQKDGTYSHVTNTDPKFKNEMSEKGDMSKLLDWAQRCGLGRADAFAQLASVQPTTHGLGPGLMHQTFSKTALFELQTRIAKLAAEKTAPPKPPQEVKPKIMDLFGTKTKEPEAQPAPALFSTQHAKAQVMDEAAERELSNAKERLGLDRDKPANVHDREEADAIMKDRSLAIMELKLISEQYYEAKKGLMQLISDLDLVYDEGLAVFYDKNKPGDKKTWNLLYGDLKRANKPMYVALDTENDVGESLFQAWLKTKFEKDAKLTEQLGIEKIESVRFGRDMTKVATYVKEQCAGGKPPAIPGIRITPAKENVFSIAPSIDTINKKIGEELKEKGLK